MSSQKKCCELRTELNSPRSKRCLVRPQNLLQVETELVEAKITHHADKKR